MTKPVNNDTPGPAQAPYDALEKERPADITDGQDSFPRPDPMSEAIAAAERGVERAGMKSQAVGHIANQAAGIENPPNPPNPQ